VIVVPARTQSTLPLSAAVMVSARVASDPASAQAAAVPGDDDAAADRVGPADAVADPAGAADAVADPAGAADAVVAVPLAAEFAACCAHPAAVRTVMTAATAVCIVLRMPVSFLRNVTDL
jgi:hypothetical protein